MIHMSNNESQWVRMRHSVIEWYLAKQDERKVATIIQS